MSLELGKSGIFYLLDSISGDIPNVIHRVSSVTTKGAMADLALDVYAMAYEPFGISKSVYDGDGYDTEIVALKSLQSRPVYVPVRFVKSVEDDTHVSYVKKALVFNLGEHHIKKTFHRTVELITKLIHEYEGMKVYGKVTDVSEPNPIPISDHRYILAKREVTRSKHISYVKVLSTKNDELQAAYAKIDALTLYIEDYLRDCNPVPCSEPVSPVPLPPSKPWDCVFRPIGTRFRITPYTHYCYCDDNNTDPSPYDVYPVEPPVIKPECTIADARFRPAVLNICPVRYYHCESSLPTVIDRDVIEPVPFKCSITVSDAKFNYISSGAYKGNCPISYYLKNCK